MVRVRGAARRGDDVSGQGGGTACGADGDGGVGDTVQGAQDRFGLAGLDPHPVDLDLVVGAAEVDEGAVGPAADEVAGAVEALTGLTGGVGDESGRGEVGAADVAARELDPAEVELADRFGRDRTQSVVQDVQGGVWDRESDGDRAARVGDGLRGRLPRGRGRVGGDVDGRLGGTVEVLQGGGGQGGGEGAGEVAAERLPAGDDQTETGRMTRWRGRRGSSSRNRRSTAGTKWQTVTFRAMRNSTR